MLDSNRSDLVAGVAGTGTMGRGIAQVLAQCGARTLVFDAQPGAARKAKEAIGQSLGKLVEKGRLKADDVDMTLGRIEIADSLEGLAPAHVAGNSFGGSPYTDAGRRHNRGERDDAPPLRATRRRRLPGAAAATCWLNRRAGCSCAR